MPPGAPDLPLKVTYPAKKVFLFYSAILQPILKTYLAVNQLVN